MMGAPRPRQCRRLREVAVTPKASEEACRCKIRCGFRMDLHPGIASRGLGRLRV